MSAQWAQFLKVTFTQLMLTCAQSAALVLMFAQAAQFLKDKIANCLSKVLKFWLGDFFLNILSKMSCRVCKFAKKVVPLQRERVGLAKCMVIRKTIYCYVGSIL
jgi:hypothetical protein